MNSLTNESFSQLVVQYERLVYTICFQLVRDAAAAEDLTQETFLSAYLRRDTMPAGYERQWLGRVAANKAKDHLQSAYNRRTVLPGDEKMPPGLSPAAEEIALQRSGEAEISHLIQAPEPYQPVCQLCLLEEKTPEEAALALGRPVKTIHTQLARGKRMLREAWKGVGTMTCFRPDGHLTDEALPALVRQGELSELERLEMAEHLAYCDACLQRYTELLAESPLLTPASSCRESLWQRLRARAVQLLVSRYATAAAAVTLALTVLWGSAGTPRLSTSPPFQSPDHSVTETLWDWPDRWNRSMDSVFSQIGDFFDHFSGTGPQTNEGGTHS